MPDWFDQNGFGATTTQPNPYPGSGGYGSLMQTVQPWTGVAPTGQPLPNPGFTPTAGFKAPTLTDDPGYAFRQAEGVKALERSTAARGVSGTPQLTKGLMRFGQELASQEYQKAYDRALGENQLAYGRALGENQLGYGRGMEQNQVGYGRGMDAYTSAYQTFLNNASATRGNQQDIYGRLLGLTGVGAGAASQTGEYATQAGNAQAAGTIGGANALKGGLDAAGQIAMLYGTGYFNQGNGLPGYSSVPR